MCIRDRPQRFFAQKEQPYKGLFSVKYADALLQRQCKPYPSADGNSFFKTNGSSGDAETLQLDKIAQGLSPSRSEWYNGRLAHAMAFLCGNLREANKMAAFLPAESDLTDEARDRFKKTGLVAFKEYLETEDGMSLLEAGTYLNFHTEVSRRSDDVDAAAKTIFSELPKLEGALQRMSLFSLKMLAFGLQSLELLAALEHRLSLIHISEPTRPY